MFCIHFEVNVSVRDSILNDLHKYSDISYVINVYCIYVLILYFIGNGTDSPAQINNYMHITVLLNKITIKTNDDYISFKHLFLRET